MITGRQIREARALLHWGQRRLSRVSRLSLGTLIRAEGVDDEAPITVDQSLSLTDTLKRAGVEFIPENGGGAGVRLKKPLAGILAQPPEGDA